jgi:MFS family permease
LPDVQKERLNKPDIEKSLRHSLKDAGAYATMIGIGETYFSAFALALNATTQQIGMLASVPAMLASFVQLLSAWVGKRTGHRKLLVLVGASIQGLALLPIAVLPLLFPHVAVPLLIGSVVLYHCGAHFAAPQWGSLMGDIVPPQRRGRFFARRTRIVSFMTFVSLVLGGIALHLMDGRGFTFEAFLLLFGVAMLARFVSVYHLAMMRDTTGQVAALEPPSGIAWWRRLRESNFARFSIFFALMQASVAISSPFFTVYMLRDLEFTYVQFMANTGMSVLAQFLTLNRWGRISDVFGNRRILATTGILIPLMPLLWMLSGNHWYLLGVQALSGLVWAGFTLSAGNFLYDLITPDKRATFLAVHNVLASISIFVGATIGGFLGAVLPTRVELFDAVYEWGSPLLGVFAISTVARLFVVVLLLPRIREVRRVRPISFGNLIFRVTRVNALAGLVFEIIGPRGRPGDPPRD